MDYIATRAAEVAPAKEAGNAGAVEDEADTATEEKELAQWAKSAAESSGGAPLTEDAGDKSPEEEAEVGDPPSMGKNRVLQRASSGEPARPGRATQRQPAQEQLVL